MKRRNFLGKIGKGLLGLGIFKAIPKQDAEPTPDIEPETEPLDLSLDTSVNSPQGIVFGADDELYIYDADDTLVVVGIEDANGDFKRTRTFNLPEDWADNLPSNQTEPK